MIPHETEVSPRSGQAVRNWVVVQWSTHALNLLRYINLSKFLGFRTIYTEEEAAEGVFFGMACQSSHSFPKDFDGKVRKGQYLPLQAKKKAEPEDQDSGVKVAGKCPETIGKS